MSEIDHDSKIDSFVYTRINHFIYTLNKTIPRMTLEEKYNIIKRFKEITSVYRLCVSPERLNFLPYHFVIHKICEELGYEKFMDFAPLPKNEIKLTFYNDVWGAMILFLENQPDSD